MEWLRLKRELNFSENVFLGGLLGFVLLLFVFTLVALSVAVLGMLVVMIVDAGILPSAERAESIRNLGLLLAATVGLPFLVWRSIVAQKQVSVAEQGHITDRINEAVKGLGAEKIVKHVKRTPRYKYNKEKEEWELKGGKPVPALRPDGEPIEDVESFEESVPNLEVRIGSIYALERIAKDSPRDHIQIMEIMCAYLRENSPAASLEPSKSAELISFQLRVDLQAALTVLGRRNDRQIENEVSARYRLDLTHTDLSGGDFAKGNFSSADFSYSRLEMASFNKSRLMGTRFFGALLNYATFIDAVLVGARLDTAIINQPKRRNRSASISINMGDIKGVSFADADITAVNFLGMPKVAQSTFGTADTKLHPLLEEERQILEEVRSALKATQPNEIQKLRDIETVMAVNGLLNWSEYGRFHPETAKKYKKFMTDLGLVGFPYIDD